MQALMRAKESGVATFVVGDWNIDLAPTCNNIFHKPAARHDRERQILTSFCNRHRLSILKDVKIMSWESASDETLWGDVCFTRVPRGEDVGCLLPSFLDYGLAGTGLVESGGRAWWGHHHGDHALVLYEVNAKVKFRPKQKTGRDRKSVV